MLTYVGGYDTLELIGDVCMGIQMLVGYIATGFCFMVMMLANLIALHELYSKKGFVIPTLGALLMIGAVAFPYLLGRGGF